jgi:hypothetical protein
MRQMARRHAIMGHEMGNAVNRRNMERLLLLSVLAERVCGYHMSKVASPSQMWQILKPYKL